MFTKRHKPAMRSGSFTLKTLANGAIAALLGTMLAVLPVTAPANAQPVAGWSLQSQQVQSNMPLTSVAYGGGYFAAMALDTPGGIDAIQSADAVNWDANFEMSSADYTSVAYCNGVFAGVSKSATNPVTSPVSTQPPGQSWWSRNAPQEDFNSVTCNTDNNTFVAVGSSGTGQRVMTSPDAGITWTQQNSAADLNWQGVTYGNGLLVAVANSGTGNRVMTSPDGINWTSRYSASDNNWTSVTYGNGLFVAVASSGTGDRVMTSPDGVNWTSRNSAADNNWTSVTFGNGQFVAVSSNSNSTSGSTTSSVMQSSNGINWVSIDSPDQHWNSVAFGNGTFVAVSSDGGDHQIMTSRMNGTLSASASTMYENGPIGLSYITTTYPSTYLIASFINDVGCGVGFAVYESAPISTPIDNIFNDYTCSGRATWVIKIYDPTDPAVLSEIATNGPGNMQYSTPSIASVTIEIYPLSAMPSATTIQCEAGGSYDIANGIAFNGTTCQGDNSGHLTLDPSVTEVGDYAFPGAPFTSLTVPNSVVKIDTYAFRGSAITQMDLGSGLRRIEDSAFRDTQLDSVTLDNALQFVGNSAFRNAPLTSLHLSSSLQFIGARAFQGANLTGTLTIPDSVTEIGDLAFSTSAIDQLQLGNSLQTIGMASFVQANLSSLSIPNSVVSIGDSAFYNAPLTSLTLGQSLQRIDPYAFENFDSNSLTIPASVRSIGNGAFERSHLTSMYVYSPIITVGSSAFDAVWPHLTCFYNYGGATFSDYTLMTSGLPSPCASYQVSASAGQNGSVSSTASAFDPGSTPTFTINPASGYQVDTVKVDGVDVTANLVASSGQTKTYTFAALATGHHIAATFKSGSAPQQQQTPSAPKLTTTVTWQSTFVVDPTQSTQLTLSGELLGKNQQVYIGGVKANIVSASDTQYVVSLPTGLTGVQTLVMKSADGTFRYDSTITFKKSSQGAPAAPTGASSHLSFGGFAPGSSVLTSKLKAALRNALPTIAKSSSLVIVGLSQGPSVLSGDLMLSKRRAEVVSAYLKLLLKSPLTIGIATQQSKQVGSAFRGVQILLHN